MICPQCKNADCTHIEIQLRDEESVQFFSCRRCEAKWWEHDGDAIGLNDVLNLTAETVGTRR